MNKRFVLAPILGVLLVVAVLFLGACLYVKWQAYADQEKCRGSLG